MSWVVKDIVKPVAVGKTREIYLPSTRAQMLLIKVMLTDWA